MREHFVISTCPSCGSDSLRKVARAWQAAGGSPGPIVELYECPNCGEEVFPPEAVRQIQAARAEGKRPSSRSRGIPKPAA